jgi:hypothetical protein
MTLGVIQIRKVTKMKIVRPVPVTQTATLTRASTGTYWDKSGVLQTAPANTLRITYDPSDLTNAPYALVEPATTNLIPQSSNFTTGWAKTLVSTTSNAGAAPDGTNSATLVATTGTAGCILYYAIIAPGNTLTYSIFFKFGNAALPNARSFGLYNITTGLDLAYAQVNYVDGSVSLIGPQAPYAIGTSEAVGGGWYRLSLTITSGVSPGDTLNVYAGATGGVYAVGEQWMIWGAQVEAGSVATSYISTTGAAVTRAADVITGTGLLYSNIAENDYPVWSSSTTYVKPNSLYPSAQSRCIVTSQHLVYESITGIIGNVKIVASASGQAYQFQLPTHGLVVGDTVLINSGANLPSNIVVGTTYYVFSVIDANTFTITTTAGGTSAVTATGAIAVVANVTGAGNVGNDPTTDTTHWVKVGPTNKWAPYDQYITSQATNSSEVVMAIVPGGRVDSLVGLNITASSAQVSMVDAAGVVVYRNTANLTSDSAIQDWYSYFYEPIVRVGDFSFTDLPIAPSATGVITVRVPNANGTAGIGGIVIGLAKEIGTTEASAKVGVTDYSVKTQDAFGTYTITQRAFSKKADFTIHLPTSSVDVLHGLLSQYRATPVVYIGSNDGDDQYSSATIYGFYKDFSIDIAYQNYSVCTLSVEGLT